MNLLGVVLLTSLGTWGLPQMVQKFYAIQGREGHRDGHRHLHACSPCWWPAAATSWAASGACSPTRSTWRPTGL
ncbi:MAG: hypothetical protein ACLR0P_02240 [Oscillospiraceae bacterium]